MFNGRKKHDKVGKKFTGGQAPRRFVSSTRRVRMLFVTDHVAELRGFQIKYNCELLLPFKHTGCTSIITS